MKECLRYEIITELINKKIKEEEARILIWLKSVRQIRRIKKRVKEEWLKGIRHKNRGRPSNRLLPKDFKEKMLKIIKEKYYDFGPTLLKEKLEEKHKIKVSKETLRQLTIKEWIWKPKKRKQPKKRHVWRARKDNYGEMEQFDWSYHKWLEGRNGRKELCLLLAVDDATWKITKAKFDEHEWVEPVFNFRKEYIEEKWLPYSIYLDKFSTYKINHPSAKDNKDLMTQFQRASKQLGIRLIHAHSPEAKGRVERIFRTLQDRLVKEMRLANISNREEANKFLKEYIPKFNKRFWVEAKNKYNFHRKKRKEELKYLEKIFSIQSTRKVNNDYTIMFKNKYYQLEENQPTTVYKKDTVIMEEHLNWEIKINLREKYLNYKILPERPKKIYNIPVCALTRKKTGRIPPKDHPWRSYRKNNNLTKKSVKNNL